MAQSLYIHIPFCEHICSYCDFCKFYYREDWCRFYLDALKTELEQCEIKVPLKTIYIGGGTPSVLSLSELEMLFQMIDQFPKEEGYEYTVEGNVENMTLAKLKLCKMYGVNRISYGVETTHLHHLRRLDRHHTFEDVKRVIQMTKEVGITNINVDFIYALLNETLAEVRLDVENFLSLDVPHVSMYSLMIEEHTKFGVEKLEPISEDLDCAMYQEIVSLLKEKGYQHYEVSNFSKPGYESKHNLVYWNNEPYYGVGLSAGGYIGNVRYTNTRSFNDYLKGNYRKEESILSKREDMENELMLGLRKLEGVSIRQFQMKFGVDMKEVFPIKRLLQEHKLKEKGGYIFVPEENIYIENGVLLELL